MDEQLKNNVEIVLDDEAYEALAVVLYPKGYTTLEGTNIGAKWTNLIDVQFKNVVVRRKRPLYDLRGIPLLGEEWPDWVKELTRGVNWNGNAPERTVIDLSTELANA